MTTLRGQHCRCPTCGIYLNSTAAFDRHRRGPYGNRRCLSPQEMRDIGMAQNSGGWWVTAALKLAPAYLHGDSRSGDRAEGAALVCS